MQLCFSEELPKGLTKQEKNKINMIFEMGRETDPPLSPIRNIAEYERMSGVLIRYPFGISIDIIRELAEDILVYCLVSSSLEGSANSSLNNANVNMDNIEFIIGQTDSYWTRDYGPWWVVGGNKKISIVDFTYNRPRPNDNNVPLKVSETLNVPYYSTDIIHAGGNYMTDGYGISASSDLVYEENNISISTLNDLMELYYGINTYHVIADPNDTYIDHIDCWAKYLSPTKILIREVPQVHPQYSEIESAANYFSETLNNWGEKWEIYRVYTPNDQPYTNSIIINNKVLVPITGSYWDSNALEVYNFALPGYEIIGFTGSWESTDALHCRVKGIPDLEMLQLFHNPLNDSISPLYQEGFEIILDIEDLSQSGLVQDSIKLFWKNSIMENYNSSYMIFSGISDNLISYRGHIPHQLISGDIHYFLKAADSSGRIETSPLAGYHSFFALQTEICNSWAIGDLNNSGNIDIFDLLILSDHIIEDINQGLCCNFVSDINSDNNFNILDIGALIRIILNL